MSPPKYNEYMKNYMKEYRKKWIEKNPEKELARKKRTVSKQTAWNRVSSELRKININ
jgi:hypothetical protein